MFYFTDVTDFHWAFTRLADLALIDFADVMPLIDFTLIDLNEL
jgi:hypothetical protein